MGGARTHTSSGSSAAGRRIPGIRIGFVTRVDDDRKIARVRVRVPGVGGQKEFAWARVASPLGGNGTGAPLIPPKGAAVIVAFDADDQNRPVVLGCLWFEEGGKSQIPKAALGDTDDVRQGRGSDTTSGTAVSGATLQEPSDPFGAEYPLNFVFKDPKSGHLIEVDGTEGKERISITHGKKETWIEIHPDGALVIGVEGKRYTLVQKNDELHVKGDRHVVVDGESSHKASEQLTLECADYDLLTKGKFNVQASKQAVLKAPTVALGPSGASGGAVVTTQTHPVDYITGIAIVGIPTVTAG